MVSRVVRGSLKSQGHAKFDSPEQAQLSERRPVVVPLASHRVPFLWRRDDDARFRDVPPRPARVVRIARELLNRPAEADFEFLLPIGDAFRAERLGWRLCGARSMIGEVRPPYGTCQETPRISLPCRAPLRPQTKTS